MCFLIEGDLTYIDTTLWNKGKTIWKPKNILSDAYQKRLLFWGSQKTPWQDQIHYMFLQIL